jgi:hypothetical protein
MQIGGCGRNTRGPLGDVFAFGHTAARNGCTTGLLTASRLAKFRQLLLPERGIHQVGENINLVQFLVNWNPIRWYKNNLKPISVIFEHGEV